MDDEWERFDDGCERWKKKPKGKEGMRLMYGGRAPQLSRLALTMDHSRWTIKW